MEVYFLACVCAKSQNARKYSPKILMISHENVVFAHLRALQNKTKNFYKGENYEKKVVNHPSFTGVRYVRLRRSRL